MTPKLFAKGLADASLSLEARALLERRSKAPGPSQQSPLRADSASSPLSSVQQMVWLSTQLDKSTPAYNRCSAIRFSGRLDVSVLQRALSEIVRRHAVLRSYVDAEGATPTLRASPAASIPLNVVDLSEVSEEDRSRHVRELLDAEARKPFDVDKGPWIRTGLISEDAVTNILYISTHHIASDGWSDAVMFRELDALYAAFRAGGPSPLGDLTLQYADFAAWQREQDDSPVVQANVAYWRNRMTGAPSTQHLPTDRQRSGLPDMRGGQVKLTVPPAITDALVSIGRQQGATLAMTMFAAFHLLQFRVTGQADSIVGLSLAGRTHPEVEGLIGLFNTVLPLRVQVDRNMTFRSLLGIVRNAVLEADAHQNVPVDSILESLPASHPGRYAEMAQTLFNFRNMPAFSPALTGLELQNVEVFNGGSVSDLELEIIEQKAGLACALRFRTDVFDETTAARLLGHYATLLESISTAPDDSVGRIELLTQAERRQILVDFNGPVRDLPPCRGIDELFSKQAAKTPQATAVSAADGVLTYRQLELCSDALGRTLQSRGVSAGDFVGVCMDRSLQMVISLLAILKCGAAFVPLDADYPPERLAHMLADTNPSLLIVDAKGQALLGSRGVNILVADIEWLVANGDELPFGVDRSDDAVACVLYTSGSTGLPKGVLSTHRGIVNNLRAMQDIYGLTADDCMLQQTSLGFDAAAWEIFWPLSVGARTCLARPGGQTDAEYIAELIASERVRIVGFAPSMLKVMLRIPAFTDNPHIGQVLSYGEVLPPRVVNDLFARMPVVEIHNLYGPAETSITVLQWNCERHTTRRSVPIGRPMSNTEVYILDPALEPVPIGVEGEIFIGGVCVSNGYHDRPALTAERFLTHPFRPESGQRVYCTGDVARFGIDGAIEYVGRRDHQLKIRGLRVELEEIEAALTQLPGVRESVVVPTKDDDEETRLIGYVSVDRHAGTSLELRRALEKRLPPQFLPALIICLDDLPHSVNGKIDRQSLPDPASFVEPVVPTTELFLTETEERVSKIWKDLLRVSNIGSRDSFFDLGGHSLLAVRMLQRLRDSMGATVSLRDFYQDPTIHAVYRILSGDSGLTTDRDAAILKVRDGAHGSAPLFYLNGQPKGGGKYARQLAPYLPADQGLYIVPVPIFEKPITVEATAAQLIRLIRAEQPVGPYFVGGNCFGATLSFEIARQLVKDGESVSLLALIHPDARAPMHLGFRAMRRLALLGGLDESVHFARFSGAFDYTLRTFLAILKQQRQSTSRQRLERLMVTGRWLKGFAAKSAKRPIAMWSTLRKREPREADELIQHEMRKVAQPVPEPDESSDQTAQMEIAAHAQYMSDAWTAYTPRPYNGRVAIIWPEDGPANPPWNPRALWTRLTPLLDWQVVPGNHWTMLHQHFHECASALGAALGQAGKK